MRRVLTLLAVLVLAAGAVGCGSDEGKDTSDPTSTTTRATTTSAPATTTTADTRPTTAPSTTSPVPTSSPGTATDAELAVVGVGLGETLAVRRSPGDDGAVVAELAPTASGIVATGTSFPLADGSVWVEVRVGDATGWADATHLAWLGRHVDITDELDPSLTAATVVDLAEPIAQARALAAEPAPTITVVAQPTDGDANETTVDSTGFADDAQMGERLHVVATKEGSGYRLRSVESTALCARGVTEDGACV